MPSAAAIAEEAEEEEQDDPDADLLPDGLDDEEEVPAGRTRTGEPGGRGRRGTNAPQPGDDDDRAGGKTGRGNPKG